VSNEWFNLTPGSAWRDDLQDWRLSQNVESRLEFRMVSLRRRRLGAAGWCPETVFL